MAIDRISSLDEGYATGDLSVFPVALDDKDILYTASNNSKTSLKQTLSYSSQIVVVEDTSGFPDKGIIRIGFTGEGEGNFELIAYNKKTGNTFQKLKRGYAGSKQGVWRPGQAWITNSVVAEHHNAVKDALINIEVDLGLKENPDPLSLNGILKQQEVRFLTPKPLFRAFPTKGPPALPVRFQNFTTGHIVRHLWDFGDGGTSLERNPIHTYLQEGQYTVKLNIITSTGAQGVATKNLYITVDKDENIPFFYVDSLLNPYSVETASELTDGGNPTEPKTFVFVDQSDGDIVQRNWVFGDGQQFTENDPDIHTISHVYDKPGSYDVTLILIYSNRRLKKVNLSEELVVL
jgi:PKD repeat protein